MFLCRVSSRYCFLPVCNILQLLHFLLVTKMLLRVYDIQGLLLALFLFASPIAARCQSLDGTLLPDIACQPSSAFIHPAENIWWTPTTLAIQPMATPTTSMSALPSTPVNKSNDNFTANQKLYIAVGLGCIGLTMVTVTAAVGYYYRRRQMDCRRAESPGQTPL